MAVRLRSDTGTIVEASERSAKRLNAQFGWKYLVDDVEPVEAVSEPAPVKRRGRPPKKESNG